MEKKRIWFNTWFNTSYYFMELLRNNSDGYPFEIWCTNTNLNSIVFKMADHWELEPKIQGPEYVEYCLEFCKKNKIDVFIPRRGMNDISEQIEAFMDNGTRVLLCHDPILLKTLNDKHLFYQAVKHMDIVQIPEYRMVETAAEFRKAYEYLTAKGHRVCFKPQSGEGGSGFRIVESASVGINTLLGPLSVRVPYDEALRILDTVDRFESLMVLEYLDGLEYSIDCLADSDGNLRCAIPRQKTDGRIRELVKKPELIRIAERIAETYKIPYIYNVQVRYSQNIPKLLEINPRMSGGLHITCMSGVNYPYLAVRMLLGDCPDIPEPDFDVSICQIEHAVKI